MTEDESFDQVAGKWDLAERRVVLAHVVAQAIQARVPLSAEQSALDFGCGTGLVTLELAPKVGTMTGADTSSRMLGVLSEKAARLGSRIQTLLLRSDGDNDLAGPYDLIVSSMALHHVPDVEALFQRFAENLRTGGQVALADLDEEDGSFHGGAMGVQHLGFPRPRIEEWLQAAGFQDIHLETATVTHKEGKDYPVFLATARKSA